MFSPITARFWQTDPLCEADYSISPYVYCHNNPINRVDPDGRLDGWIEDKDGNVKWDTKTNSSEEFKQNYTNKGLSGYKYVSDVNSPSGYTLPSGDGKLVINEWSDYVDIEDGVGSCRISITFISNNDKYVNKISLY